MERLPFVIDSAVTCALTQSPLIHIVRLTLHTTLSAKAVVDMFEKSRSDGSADSVRQSPQAILQEPEVLALIRLPRTSLWRRRQAGDFPAPVRLGAADHAPSDGDARSSSDGWRSCRRYCERTGTGETLSGGIIDDIDSAKGYSRNASGNGEVARLCGMTMRTVQTVASKFNKRSPTRLSATATPCSGVFRPKGQPGQENSPRRLVDNILRDSQPPNARPTQPLPSRYGSQPRFSCCRDKEPSS